MPAMNPTIEALHRRLRNATPEADDLERFATAIGVDGEDGLDLCREALGGDLEAAMQLWRKSLPDRPLRIRADHTLTAARLCAHLLKEISEGPPSPEIPLE